MDRDTNPELYKPQQFNERELSFNRMFFENANTKIKLSNQQEQQIKQKSPTFRESPIKRDTAEDNKYSDMNEITEYQEMDQNGLKRIYAQSNSIEKIIKESLNHDRTDSIIHSRNQQNFYNTFVQSLVNEEKVK